MCFFEYLDVHSSAVILKGLFLVHWDFVLASSPGRELSVCWFSMFFNFHVGGVESMRNVSSYIALRAAVISHSVQLHCTPCSYIALREVIWQYVQYNKQFIITLKTSLHQTIQDQTLQHIMVSTYYLLLTTYDYFYYLLSITYYLLVTTIITTHISL